MAPPEEGIERFLSPRWREFWRTLPPMSKLAVLRVAEASDCTVQAVLEMQERRH